MAQFPNNPKTASPNDPPLLAWTQQDIENRIGFKGGRYTDVNHLLAFLIGTLLTGVVYVLMVFVFARLPGASMIATMYMRPTNQFAIIPANLFFFGGLAILFLKAKKIQFQRRALDLSAVPAEPDFVLTETTAATVLARIHSLVDHPRYFILLNRIDRALSNFKNMGQVNDVSAVLRAQAENDEDQIASSYTLLNGFVWAIPVLGFIGTVLGLSLAIGRFTLTIQAGGDITLIRSSLQGVSPADAAKLQALFNSLPKDLVYLAFCVFEDSFPEFNRAKEIAMKSGLAYGWDPFRNQDGPVSFGPIGHRPKPQ